MAERSRFEQLESEEARCNARQRVATVWAASVEEIRYSRKTGAD
jgi:hypothetical protein